MRRLLGVATPGICARILKGSEHINMGLDLVLTIQGIGASMSNARGRNFAHKLGYSAAFPALAATPCIGLIIFHPGRWQKEEGTEREASI